MRGIRNSFKGLWVFILLSFVSLNAQEVKKCGTDEMLQELLQKDPTLQSRMLQAEQEIQKLIMQIQKEEERKRTTSAAYDTMGSEYVIPVVVHVIHENGPEKISIEQVKSGIVALFRDFRKVPGTMGNFGVDTKIEFALATKAPNGQPHTGVNYVYNPQWTRLDRGTSEEQQMKSSTQWDKTKYLNIWLVKEIISSGNQTILGYAYFPGTVPYDYDGVVIRADCWGTTGYIGGPGGDNLYGRTATHEMGHALNLYHTFQGGCGTSACQFSGDYICDTPPVARESYGSYTQRKNSCTNDNPDRPDDPRNYMDYLDDLYLDHFTNGQRLRMVAALNNPSFSLRYPLWQASNLQATGTGPYGPPKAQFWASHRYACVNSPIQFIDYSMNTPVSYEWRFPGGNPSTSTQRNPIVTYPAPGTYDVTLIVGNLFGVKDTLTLTNFITITDRVDTLPFVEHFNSTTFPPSGWIVIDQEEGMPAGHNSAQDVRRVPMDVKGMSAPSTEMGCARFSHYNIARFDVRHALVTPAISIQNATNPTLSFYYAYTPYYYKGSSDPAGLLYADTLSVYVSTDCGYSWTRVYHKGGLDLRTTSSTYGTNNPDPSKQGSYSWVYDQDWRKVTIDLSPYISAGTIKIKFETIGNFGNHLYIDSVAVMENAAPVGIENSVSTSFTKVTLSPNPTSSDLIAHITTLPGTPLTLAILNPLGQVLYSSQILATSQEMHITIPTKELAKGFYLLQVKDASSQTLIQRFVKE